MEKKGYNLQTLAPAAGSRHRRKRLGIGEGSGSGKTSGRGTKGYGARSGWKQKPGFEGGQMPLHRRLPKFGFTSRKKVLGENVFTPVQLQRIVDSGLDGTITLDTLLEAGITRTKGEKVKLLSGIPLSKKFVIEAHAVSASALKAIQDAGGDVKIVAPIARVAAVAAS